MIDFTNNTSGPNADTLATADSVHETVRKAIKCCDGDTNIVLTLDSAMELVREWDAYVGKYGAGEIVRIATERKKAHSQ